MEPDEIRRQLEYFRDLGFTELYQRPPATAEPLQETSVPVTELPAPAPEPDALPLLTAKEVLLPSMAPVDDTLAAIRAISAIAAAAAHAETETKSYSASATRRRSSYS